MKHENQLIITYNAKLSKCAGRADHNFDTHLLLGDVSGFDGGGAILIPPGGGGSPPLAPVRVRLDDSDPSFFYITKR